MILIVFRFDAEPKPIKMKYKVISFPRSKTPSESLQTIINEHTVNGWRYTNHQYSDKLTPGKAGCFGIGAQPDFVAHVGMVVFEKE